MPTSSRARRETPRSGFRRSVNVAFDVVDGGVGGRYVVTGCVQRTLERVLGAIVDDHGARAWTLTGPYGTGKSSFALFLASVLGGDRMASHGSLVAALRKSAPDLGRQLARVTRGGRDFLPVLVSGAREPLTDALVRASRAALERCQSRAARDLLRRLPNTGQRTASIDPVALLASMHECVVKNEKGCAGTVLVLDELGKLLEFVAAEPSKSDIHVLQRLAEYAARAVPPMLVLGVLHQDFSGYARELPATERAEWEKVRGRFEDVAFDEPVDETLRLISHSWQGLRKGSPKDVRNWQNLCEETVRLGLSPRALPPKEAVALLASCWPLHPLTALVLGPVFKRFGQNERSAFSFLQSHEPLGLREFVERNSRGGDLFTVSHLYDYLVGTIGDALLHNRDGKRWAEALDIERRLSDVDPATAAVFKTIALLGIVGRWHDVAPSADTVRFALAPNVIAPKVQQALAGLAQRSVVVERKYNNSFSLWEGSDVDIESRLAAARSALPADSHTAGLLQKHFRMRPMIARRHSFDTGTLRLFSVEHVQDRNLETIARSHDRNADGRVLVVFGEHDTPPQVDTTLAILGDMNDIVAAMPRNNREIAFLARELACLQWVRDNTPALVSDSTARLELEVRESDVRRRLQTELSQCLFGHADGAAGTTWLYRGKKRELKTQRDLNELLSKVCDELFADAPIIKNEIINRRELSSSAAAARRNLIERMIQHGKEPEVGITGNPPERSIYLSVLRGLGLHVNGSTGWHFTTDLRSAKNKGEALFAAVRSFFDQAEGQHRTVAELFDQLQQPPCGLRLGVVPLVVCAALLAHEADVALYEQGAFVPMLTVPIFERLIKSPEGFTLRRWRVTGVRSTVFHQLAQMLGKQALPVRIGRREVLDVVKPLISFVRKLDEYTLRTSSLDRTAVAVRQALLGATEPDQLLFADLPLACGVKPFDSKGRMVREEVQRYLTALQESISNLQRAYDRLLSDIHAAIAGAFDCALDLRDTRIELVRRAKLIQPVALDPELKTLVTRVVDSAPDDRQWIESVAALLASSPPPVWRDDDRARFDIALSQRARRFKGLECLLEDRKHAGQADGEMLSIRLGVAGTALPDRETIVHVGDREMADATTLAGSLLGHLQDYATNGHRVVAVAALAKAAHEFLESSAVSVPAGASA